MSQTKAQLVAPVGVVTATAMNVSGVLTATTFDGGFTGSASSITQGKNLNVGIVTASGIAGDITGSATSITQGTNVTFGSLTASRLVGNLTGNAVGNALGDALSATVTGVTTSNNISVGVLTATSFRGDGTNISGVPAGAVSSQNVAITSATTSIDLSNGNLIYMNQSASTTVSFANSENGYVYIIRTKDDNSTARTITWPTGIGWSGGTAPKLINNPRAADAQVFSFVTRDEGVTWDAKEVMRSDPDTFALWSWGTNNQGQLGQNQPTSLDLSSPTQVGSGGVWDRVHSARQQTFALKDNGTMWVWGYSSTRGTLGLNEAAVYYSSPTQLGTETTWSKIESTTNVALATKTDGTLWTWGTNYKGQMGQNSSSYPGGDRSSPIQIGTDTTWDKLGRARYNSWGIKTDGSLWGWGINYYGQLGQNSVNQPNNVGISSPTQVPGTTWEVISGCEEHALAKKTDGTLWAWGQNENGVLGLNNHDGHRSSPTQVGTETTWNSICAGLTNLATKTDGTIWVWGANEYGQLGLNSAYAPNYIGNSSPTQIGTDTTWSGLVAIEQGMFATKTDGTLWSWGYNNEGQLGQNQTSSSGSNSYSSPTQIPGTDWNIVHGEQTGDGRDGNRISWLRAG